MTGSSTQGIKTVLHPVSDLAKAKEVYAALLGVSPEADAPYYVGFEAAGQHIGLVPTAPAPDAKVLGFFKDRCPPRRRRRRHDEYGHEDRRAVARAARCRQA